MAPGKFSFSTYFLTETGRQVVFGGAVCTAITLFSSHFIPHSIFSEKYKEIIQSYKYGVERKIPERVENRLEIALNKLQVTNYERKIIKAFACYGFDVLEIGTTTSRFGAFVGIPVNYNYVTARDIDKQDILIRGEMINWSSEDGERLKEALVLTEDEQIFGICRAILHLQSYRVLLNSLFPSLTFAAMYSVGNTINNKMNFYAKPFMLRGILYSILGMFGYGVYSFITDYTNVSYETEVDRKLSDLGPEFVESGIRFYDKLLKRNMAIRNLTGDSTYTAKGNTNTLLRQKNLPLTLRKMYFEERLNELKKKLEETDNIENV